MDTAEDWTNTPLTVEFEFELIWTARERWRGDHVSLGSILFLVILGTHSLLLVKVSHGYLKIPVFDSNA